jgi:tRNA wybutosine-synthesizing protein 3
MGGAKIRARHPVTGIVNSKEPQGLHTPTMKSRFDVKKGRILEQIQVPDDAYTDLSPKGSIDEPIRSLIDDINRLDGLVTTSSCSGRISVFLEGRKKNEESDEDGDSARAGPGGKGGGGSWLFVSHYPVEMPDDAKEKFHFMDLFDVGSPNQTWDVPSPDDRFIHLKFEPMVGFHYRLAE